MGISVHTAETEMAKNPYYLPSIPFRGTIGPCVHSTYPYPTYGGVGTASGGRRVDSNEAFIYADPILPPVVTANWVGKGLKHETECKSLAKVPPLGQSRRAQLCAQLCVAPVATQYVSRLPHAGRLVRPSKVQPCEQGPILQA